MRAPQIVLTDQNLSFAGNDYLSLAQDRRLADAAYAAALEYGVSASSSRWALGWNPIFAQLEADLIDYFAVKDVCLLGSAFIGGMVYFASIKERVDLVLIDQTAHVNLFKGLHAADIPYETFKHLDVDGLKQLLQQHKSQRLCIATDGLWGISGEIPALRTYADLAKQEQALLFIDDAHGVFHMGQGKGTAAYCGLEVEDACVLGSLSKALGCGGGFLMADEELVHAFRTDAATSGTATGTIPNAAAAIRAIDIVKSEPERILALDVVRERLLQIITSYDLRVLEPQSPIIAMDLNNEADARMLSACLSDHHLMTPYFKYASEPRHNLLRIAAKSSYNSEYFELFESALQQFVTVR